MKKSLKQIKRITIWLSSLLLVGQAALAQEASAPETNLFNNKLHITLSTRHFINQKAEIDREKGQLEILSRNSYGFEFGTIASYNFQRRFAISAGLFVGMMQTRYDFEADFNSIYDNPSLFGDVTIWGDWAWFSPVYISLPIGIHFRIPVRDQFLFSFSYSLNPQNVVNGEYEGFNGADTDSGQHYDVAYLYIGTTTLGFAFGHQFSTGITCILPNQQFLNFNLLMNMNFKKPYRGFYRLVYDTPEITLGDYANTLNYLGIDLSYTFTGVRHRKKKGPKMKY